MAEDQEDHQALTRGRRRRRCCLISLSAAILLLVSISITILVLSLTIFKPRVPEIQVLSSTIDGISPRVTFPSLRLSLNVSVNLTLLVKNQNRVSFRHGSGTTSLFYRGVLVGEDEMSSGDVPAMRSVELRSRLTVQVDKVATVMGDLVRDVAAGEMLVASYTEVPGRVTLMKVIKKHVAVTMNCRFVVGVMDMKIRSQDCKQKAKL